jgi:hypothetical protein
MPDATTALGDNVYSKGRIFIDSDLDLLEHWNGTEFALTAVARLHYRAWLGTLASYDLESWPSATFWAIESYQTAYVVQAAGDRAGIVSNAYYSDAWYHKASGYSGYFYVEAHQFGFYSAATGVANSSLTFVYDFLFTGSQGSSSTDCTLGIGGGAGGSDRDSYIWLASDAYLFWDKSEDELGAAVVGTRVAKILTSGFAVIDSSAVTRVALTTSGGVATYDDESELTNLLAGDQAVLYATLTTAYSNPVVMSSASSGDLTVEEADILLSLKPRVYKSAVETDPQDAEMHGFISEEVAALGVGSWVGWDASGKYGQAVSEIAMMPAVVLKIQDHERRLSKLETLA